jgi:hypothetical protein
MFFHPDRQEIAACSTPRTHHLQRRLILGVCTILGATGVVGLAVPASAAAPPMTVIAVGDSYASGEGAIGPGWINPTCHESPLAAPRDAANQLNAFRPTSFISFACTAATTSVVRGQLASIPLGPVEALTMSVGGNDIGFGSIITTCLISDCTTLDASVTLALSSIPGGLPSRLANVFAAVPGNVRHVFITEYPDPTTGQSGALCGTATAPAFQGFETITATEAAWASSRVIGRLNAVIATAVAAANNQAGPHPSFHFVTGISARFATHGYCTGGGSPAPWTWFNPRYIATPLDSLSSQLDEKGSMHPNDLGQREIAAALFDAMRFLTVGNVSVPDVLGHDQATATTRISAAGLIPIRQIVPDTACPTERLVVGQSPYGGARVWPGDQVVYQIAVPHPKYCR